MGMGRKLRQQIDLFNGQKIGVGDHIVCDFIFGRQAYRVDKIYQQGPSTQFMLTNSKGITRSYNRVTIIIDFVRKLETPQEIALYGVSAPVPDYCKQPPNPIFKFFLNLKRNIKDLVKNYV